MKTKLPFVLLLSLWFSFDVSARPRPALPPLPEFTLNHWHFEQTNWWTVPRTAPDEMVNVSLVESWSGYAVRVQTNTGAVLRFPAVNSAGKINLALEEGSVRFWFAPGWSSSSLGGTGPSSWGRLLDVGAWSADASHGWWSLYFDPSGTNLLFSVQADGVGEDYLAASIAWQSNEWHQITLTYGPKFTALYLDGELAAAGPAISALPAAKVFVDTGFTVGSDTAGGNLARGTFDELATFAFPLGGDTIATTYQWAAPQAALGPITAEEEEAWREWSAKLKAARALEAESGGGMMMMLLSGGCPELKLTATLLTNSDVQIDICGKELNARYDLITTTNLNPTIGWQWLQEVPYPTNALIVSTNTAHRFFQLKKVPDLDGDGQRDYWEWGGSVPGGIVIDDDRDQDGIPDSIETAAGSATNDPASLPPPSLYVNTNSPAGGDGSLDLPFRDIQTALNVATNYSVILVKPGTYSGASNRNLSFGGKRLVLVSEKGWEATMIHAGSSSNQIFSFTSTNEDYRAQVVGFSIQFSGTTAPPGATCTGGSAPTFVNCEFRACNAGAVGVTNSSPVFVNCRFRGNSTATAGKNGAAVFATGSASLVRLSHCLIADNNRITNGGQIYSTGGATVSLNNSIVWAAGISTNFGADIVTSGGTVTARYCNVRDGYAGEGNIDSNPLFEAGSTYRLTSASPCIDQGVSDGLPGFGLFTRYDMDGEQRLDHFGFADAASTTDIGADEFVYRLQFPTGTGVSVVDEASGVSFLGTNSIGPVVAVVNDEARTGFHTFQLNSNATAVVNAYSNNVVLGSVGEVNDLEGVTFDKSTSQLYLITSQTKRNRYRDVDNIDSDPVSDPPSNDYDQRRTKLIRVTATANLTNITLFGRVACAAESNGLPTSVGYDATNGLASFIRQSLMTNVMLDDRSITNRVLIARNTANKFGTPVNGVSYGSGASLPYKDGGPSLVAGTSLGEFTGTSGVLTNNGLTSNTWYYYKIWAIDQNTNYTAGITASNKTDGVPKLFINEFLATGTNDLTDPDWIEIYNPARVAVSTAGLFMTDDVLNLLTHPYVPVPLTNIPPRGYARFLANNTNTGMSMSFALGANGEHMRLNSVAGGATNLVDDYGFGNQSAAVTEGRAWDAGPRGFVSLNSSADGAKYRPNSPYPPTSLIGQGIAANNHTQSFKHFSATADVRATNIYLEWGDVGYLPPVWRYSPKQFDFHSVNIEDIAFRSTNEMILGLRSPLVNRTNGNAYYFMVTNVLAFTPATLGWSGLPAGITGPFEMNLGGLGIRSIKWCPDGLTNSAGQAVQRYLIIAGASNGGPLVRERARQKFSLYSWTGVTADAPVIVMDDLQGYAVRPEGIDIMRVGDEWRLLFVEDRYLATGYGTRNAIHWPVNVFGPVN